jgi:hypothetical protein
LKNYTKYKTAAIQKQEERSFIVELTIDDDRPFYDILLEAIDNSFLSLGEPVKTSIYSFLENSMGIRKSEIPFRISDFQNALEKIFGIGTRKLEILFIKNLHQKTKIKYRKDLPSWMVPDLTFQEYIRLVRIAYENSTERTDEQVL